MTNPYRGPSFDEFLAEEGILEEVEQIAIRRVIAWQLQQEMRQQNISKVEMARRMETSRSQLDRLLNPESSGLTLETIERGARAVGRRLHLELV